MPTTILPSEIIVTVTGAPQSIFACPSVDTSPELFTSTDVTLQVELNGVVQTITTEYSETPAGYVTFVTPVPVSSTVRISRTTVSSAPLATASVASMFSTTMFNKGFWQLLFLIQEVKSLALKCLAYVVTSLGEIVWDFQSRRGINCAEPTGAQDVATKNYTDVGDAAARAYALSLVNTEAATRAAADSTLLGQIIAGDAQTLAAAQAYTRNWFPSITYVSGTDIPLIPTSQVCPVGTTRIFFPVAVYELVLSINGMCQGPADYTFVPGNNYVDLTEELGVSSIINAHIVGSAVISVFSAEVVSAAAGDTVITTVSPFDGAFVTIDGALQSLGADYTHSFGTNTLTLTNALLTDSTVQVIAY